MGIGTKKERQRERRDTIQFQSNWGAVMIYACQQEITSENLSHLRQKQREMSKNLYHVPWICHNHLGEGIDTSVFRELSKM